MQSKVVVALDGMDLTKAVVMAKRLEGKVWGFKVNDLLVDVGSRIVTILKQHGKVFADPKLFDIPNTVSNSVKKLVAAGADLITVHALGGPRMLKAAVDECDGILAVTVLTSMHDDELACTYNLPAKDARRIRVSDLAFLAHDCKCRGIICAADDLQWVGHYKMLKIIPGVRPPQLGDVKGDDQVHKGEIPDGDLLVVGRPITQAAEPVEAVDALNRLIGA